MNELRPDQAHLPAQGQAITTPLGSFIVTAVGLPNSCAGCGQPQAGLWLARHEDEARSGGGRCPTCAGLVTETAIQEAPGDTNETAENAPGNGDGSNEEPEMVTDGTGQADGADTNDGTAVPDDLTVIKGIGQARAAELAQLGIVSFQALAAADIEFLDTAVEVNRTQIADWMHQAAALAGQ